MNIQYFTDFFEENRPKRATSSNKQYGLRLGKMCSVLDIKSVDDMDDPDKILDYIKDSPVTTKANVLVAVNDYLRCNDDVKYKKTIDILHAKKNVFHDLYKHRNCQGTIVASQEKNIVTLEELYSYYDTIKDIVKERDYENTPISIAQNGLSEPAIDYLNLRILLRLYLLHPSRNEYATLEMIPVREFNKIEHPMKNYLVYSNKTPASLSINIYKTMNKYGEKRIPIKDKELITLIKFHHKKFGYGVMFRKQNGTNLDEQYLCQVFRKYSLKHIQKAISSTLIYKILISKLAEKYETALNEEDMDNIEKYRADLDVFAKTRGHSAGIQKLIYSKKIKSPEEKNLTHCKSMPVKDGEKVFYKIKNGEIRSGIYNAKTKKVGRAMPPKKALHHTEAGARKAPWYFEGKGDILGANPGPLAKAQLKKRRDAKGKK